MNLNMDMELALENGYGHRSLICPELDPFHALDLGTRTQMVMTELKSGIIHKATEEISNMKRLRGPSVSVQEDENICKAWLSVQEEMLSGLDHKGTPWNRILEVYNKLMGTPTNRSKKVISNRWFAIQQNINIFYVYLLNETNKDASASLVSRVANAKREFCVSQKFPFKWDGCWEILKDSAAWKAHQAGKLNMKDGDKRLKRVLENVPIDTECASSNPITPRSQPTTPTLTPFGINTNPASSGQIKRRESEEKDEEQIVHFSKVVQRYQVTTLNMKDANKRLKPMLENECIDMECASSTPITPVLQPTTATLIPFHLDTNAASSGQTKEKESEKKDEEKMVKLFKVVEETNSLLKTFMCSVDERLGRSEDIARRNLQLKEEKLRQRQLETRESQFERDRQIMDMNLEHMPSMQRQFYKKKQKEICDRWEIEEHNLAGEGSSGELECVGTE